PHIAPPSRYEPAIDRQIDEIVMTALAFKPEARFATCRAFANALEQQLQRLEPTFNDAHLVRFLKHLFEKEVGPEKFAMAAPTADPSTAADSGDATKPRRQAHRPVAPATLSAVSEAESEPSRPPPSPQTGRVWRAPDFGDHRIAGLIEKLSRHPNLWTLHQLAEILAENGYIEHAVRIFRAGGMKFAQHGHLVQAVAHYAQIKRLRGWSADLAVEVEGIRTLPGQRNATLLRQLGALDQGPFDTLLQNILTREEPNDHARQVASPLFSLLDSAEFANLVGMLELRRVNAGEVIVEEGDPSDGLSIIARGRVLIYCRNFHGAKVYLSSLSDGDCFGEFSFFTNGPRTATVEALEDGLLFDIKQTHFDRIQARFPNLTYALVVFYKERVVKTLLAKSEVFGGLHARTRQWLLERLTLERKEAGETILREGDQSDGFFLIKSGEVQVFSERKGHVFLRKLGPGDFFGEVAALTKGSRNASVRALGACELLKLTGDDLHTLLRTNPDVESILLTHIAKREAETARRLTAGGALT
ncbi:MAG: cyclic nucleotide-binding domain-containing protein, partial [Myxococcota bacterium]